MNETSQSGGGWLRRVAASCRHAFAVDPPGPAIPTAAEREIIDRVLVAVVRRQMVGPAILFLESSRPLNFISAQALHFFGPITSLVVDADALSAFAKFLERRGSIPWICQRLEELEAAREQSSGLVGDAERGDLGP
ncbi:MAG: hypothetical protein SGJ11_14820 [Phycisphaerae bacterium]|nr:hypothetical protein [Phycisphaerae bacterium]